jgi:diacylglycerol kinase family enzyme
VAFADRATTIVVANGQFLRGRDLVPSGHPGDGRLEVQVYALAPAGRRPMRRRLAVGTHLPHPGIVVTHGRVVELALGRPAAVEADGIRLFSAADVVVEAVPGAYRLLL